MAMTAKKLYRARLPAKPEQLKKIRDAVKSVASNLYCNEDLQREVVLAVDEACCNIIRHAYGGGDGDIVFEILQEDKHLLLRIQDFAAPIDTKQLKPRNLSDLRPGGLGLHFMRQVMDEVRFSTAPDGSGNILEMRKKLG